MKFFYVIFLNDYISEVVEFVEYKRISTSKFVKFNRFEFYSLRSILTFFDFIDVCIDFIVVDCVFCQFNNIFSFFHDFFHNLYRDSINKKSKCFDINDAKSFIFENFLFFTKQSIYFL